MTSPSPFIEKLYKAFKSTSPPVCEELTGGAKAFLVSALLESSSESILYISGSSSPRLLDDLDFFSHTPLELPQSSELEASSDVRGIELKTLASLKRDPKKVVVGSLQALYKKYVSPDALNLTGQTFHNGNTYPFSRLKSLFETLGYSLKSIVTEKGVFAIRGGIIDVFPYENAYPIRMEFDDDELISIREFDPLLQTSLKKITAFSLMGCQNQEASCSIFDYLTTNPLIIFDGLEELEELYVFSQRIAKNKMALGTSRLLFFAEKPLSILFSKDDDTERFLDLGLKLKKIAHPFLPPSSFFITASKPSFEELDAELPPFKTNGGQAVIVYSTEAEKNIILQNCPTIQLKPGFLSSGFYTVDPLRLVLSYHDFFDKKTIRRARLRESSVGIEKEFDIFNPGDVVVHAHQGIGKCLGVEKRLNHLGQESEYFKLEFLEKAILYVPIKDAHLITRYVGTSQSLPTFSQLGSSRWQKIRLQTQASIVGYAQKLLELAAHRQLDKGFHYPDDSSLIKQFEDDFPFAATDDQLKAILSIKQDMQKGVPMDRLICGDVGYGKTEVAMRAAFKAVVDGHKQVAVLVPTTVLAMQHFENFKDRMSNFPIKLGILSRFNSPKEIKNTLSELQKGHLDIVIGTHRILSSDVIFKDLGLMIVDEEQRFGVKAKESLKEIKKGVDCLTLSATPIPRTLYTSIVGMKQMSVIATPPYDRLPVKTHLTITDDEFIKAALLKEISRKGQSYFIHNRVENLPLIHKKLQAMIPEAKIGIAHGQMDAEAIDTVFHGFKTGQLDILIATTLVENGVDIPNANTILIDNAHNFGISDLYQLRGRVGRWNKAATCYLLIPKNTNLDEPTRKRLEAIVSTSGYGGGLKVAMRDLEIRGAGDLLGIEQSGHVSQVGFTLYCKMLKKTVSSLQKKQPLNATETKMELVYEAKIPDTYISDLDTRIEFYHRLGDLDSEEDADQALKELIDRFGKPPITLLWLFVISKLKVFCMKHYILSLSIQKLSTTFEKSHKGKIEKHAIAINSGADPLQFEKALKDKMRELL